jgi:hypothetical protein
VKEESTTNKSVPGELLNISVLSYLKIHAIGISIFFFLDNLTSLVPVVVVPMLKLI